MYSGNRKEPDSLLGKIFHLVPKVEREDPGTKLYFLSKKNAFETLKHAVTSILLIHLLAF